MLLYGFMFGAKNGYGTSTIACTGPISGAYECGGRGNFIKWNQNFGTNNFVIRSEFEATSVSTSGLYFGFHVANAVKYIGLDCTGKTVCYGGGAWGLE